jgi:hypothetical protein
MFFLGVIYWPLRWKGYYYSKSFSMPGIFCWLRRSWHSEAVEPSAEPQVGICPGAIRTLMEKWANLLLFLWCDAYRQDTIWWWTLLCITLKDMRWWLESLSLLSEGGTNKVPISTYRYNYSCRCSVGLLLWCDGYRQDKLLYNKG